VTPESIPDTIAYRHFVIAAATTEVPSRRARDKREMMLADIGLNADDRVVFLNAVTGVRERIADIDKRIATASDVAAVSGSFALRDEKQALLDSISDRLRKGLSTGGRLLLQTYIDNMKREIRIFGDVP
jgi:hypothetical protein